MKNLITWLLFLLAVKLSSADGDTTETPADSKATDTENVSKTVKQPEKRGTVRVAVIPGSVGQNYPYRLTYSNDQPPYTLNQQTARYSNQQTKYQSQPQYTQYSSQPTQYSNQHTQYSNQPTQYSNNPSQYSSQPTQLYRYSSQPHYDNSKTLATISTPVKYPQFVLPTPYSSPAMLLVLAQPSTSSPYFMLIPQNSFPQYNLPYLPGAYEAQQRVAYIVPQYVAKTPYNYLSRNAGYAAAQQLVYNQKEPLYQEAAETTQAPGYGNRVRPLEQYSKV